MASRLTGSIPRRPPTRRYAPGSAPARVIAWCCTPERTGSRTGCRASPTPRPGSAARGAPPGVCLFLYAGTQGISHGLPGIADAAPRLGGEPVHFAFVGEGSDKPRLERRVAALGLDNVTMLPGVPHEEVPALLAAADICLVPLRDVPLFSTFIPSKLFEYLAAGKAVIGAVTGEAAQILRAAGAVVVPPEDSIALADAIAALADDPERRQLMGKHGRSHLARYFDP